jgi:class I fructose-bisphosphate aldolase
MGSIAALRSRGKERAAAAKAGLRAAGLSRFRNTYILSASMNTGKLVRLNRLFSHSSGRLCSVAVDHFIIYGAGIPEGLRKFRATVAAVVEARPDAVTMHVGMAGTVWPPHAGSVPLILQSSLVALDDSFMEQSATPEDAVRMGADAFALVALVRGPSEGRYLRRVADCVREAARFEMPVICHTYARSYSEKGVGYSYAPEDIAWAARCAVEVGADVVKVPYCGEVSAYSQIVAECPVRIVAAGGPQTPDLRGALAMMAEVVKSGAAGATIGRNIWGVQQIGAAVRAFKAVLHDGLGAQAALQKAGL